MKPIGLRMKNFGPFKNEAIDFGALGDMFLIMGKTGSGKTTIFDAMTYAIYGKYSGSRKGLNQDQMRSNFAKVGEESFVEFSFSVEKSGKTEKYRVTRTLPQPYINRKGILSTKTSSVALERDSGNGWETVKGNTGEEYTKKLQEEIIGLKHEEFSQIVLLPQGEFSEFLRKNSKDRDEMLKKIFPIELIESAAEKIREKSKAFIDRLRMTESRIAEIGADGETRESLKSKIGALEEERNLIEENREKFQREASEKAALRATLEARRQEAKRLSEAREALSKIESEREEIGELSKMVEKSREARILLPEIEGAKNSAKKAEEARTELLESEKRLSELGGKLAELEKSEGEMDALSKRVREMEIEVGDMRKKAEILKELEKSVREKENAQKILTVEKEKSAEFEKTLEEKTGEIRKIGGKFKIGGEEKISRIPSVLIERRHEASKRRQEAEEAAKNSRMLSERRKILSGAQENFDAKKREFEAADTILSDLEAAEKENERKNLAFTLARTLKAGCPCPVCGSTEHPKIAEGGGVSLEEKIKFQKKNVETAKKSLDAASEKLLNAKRDVENLSEIINPDAGEGELEKSLEAAMEDERLVSEAAKRAQELSAEIEEIEEKKAEAEKTLNALNTEVEKLSAKIEEQRKAAGGNQQDAKKIEGEIHRLKSEIESGRAKTQEFGEALHSARTEKEKTAALREKCSADLEKFEAEREKNEKSLSEKIEKSSFSDAQDAKSKILEAAAEKSAEERIQNWRTALETQKKFVESAEVSESVDALDEKILEITKSEAEIQQRQDENSALAKENAQKISEKTRTLEELLRLEGELSAAQEESGPYIHLAGDLDGKNPKSEKFTSWVLAMYFSEVLDYANERLEKLSGGRYQFIIGRTSNRGTHGLDLAIEDFATGSIRPTTTLSGGETFQASISLALGLTDVVSSHSGGVRLDSLFIDEGFGTLDPESLEKALETLHQIQQQRMVGVISHVEAMETEIRSHIVAERDEASGYSRLRCENLGFGD